MGKGRTYLKQDCHPYTPSMNDAEYRRGLVPGQGAAATGSSEEQQHNFKANISAKEFWAGGPTENLAMHRLHGGRAPNLLKRT